MTELPTFLVNGMPAGADNPLSQAIDLRDRSTLQMVRDAVAQGRIALAYQPVMQTACPDRPAFYESLLRVMEPGGRVIPARDFMAAVEETETGRQLDCIALETGLRTLALQPRLRLSVNMSARSIGYPRWVETLERGLHGNPTLAERLILEITETSAMAMPELVQVFMNRQQRLGMSFALDDFGAGYTSFRYLRDFFFDVLKIDGQFVRNIDADPDNQVLASALVSIGRHFEMFTVAESVETLAEADYLTGIGIDCMQGYFFGAPSLRPHWLEDSAIRAAG